MLTRDTFGVSFSQSNQLRKIYIKMYFLWLNKLRMAHFTQRSPVIFLWQQIPHIMHNIQTLNILSWPLGKQLLWNMIFKYILLLTYIWMYRLCMSRLVQVTAWCKWQSLEPMLTSINDTCFVMKWQWVKDTESAQYFPMHFLEREFFSYFETSQWTINQHFFQVLGQHWTSTRHDVSNH